MRGLLKKKKKKAAQLRFFLLFRFTSIYVNDRLTILRFQFRFYCCVSMSEIY